MTAPAFDPRELRQALGTFLTGVTVVTTLDQSEMPRGFTANSFTSVSLDPPLVLVCIAKHAGSYPVFEQCDGFGINILSEQQQELACCFSSPTSDRFSNVTWRPGPAGHPVFADTAAWLDCHRHQLIDAGDHLIMIGRVAGLEHTSRPPLGYSRVTYVSASLERSASMRRRLTTEVVAVLECLESVLLVGGDAGPLTLPRSSFVGTPDDPESLLGRLGAAGINAELGFVFSVVDDPSADSLRIIYRGTADIRAGANSSYRLYGLRSIPWDRLDAPSTRIALRRYVQERVQDRFGIYFGGPDTGQIAELISLPKVSTNEQIESKDYDLA